MQRRVFLSLTAMTALAGCGGFRNSRANPRNWFGGARTQDVPAEATPEQINPLIPEREDSIFRRRRDEDAYEGTLVDQITSLEIEPTSDGAIVRVEGRTLRQDAYDVRLESDSDGEPVNGLLEFRLKAIQPAGAPQGPTGARTVIAAAFVSAQDIAATQTVRVLAARNLQESKR